MKFPTYDADIAWLKRVQENLGKRSVENGKFDKIYDILRSKRLVRVAITNVLRNKGARTPGMDGISRRDLESIQRRSDLVDEVTAELRSKKYRPTPVRRTYIPKANGKLRPLGIPTIKDRVVQEMLRLILEPIYEGKFYRHSYGFRPYRSTHHAASRLWNLHGRYKFDWVVEGDIKACFDEIDHRKLKHVLRKEIKDERVIKLVGHFLSAGYVEEDGVVHKPPKGTPQGGIVSPLLANIFLNELDQFVAEMYDHRGLYARRIAPRRVFLVRYADDFVIVTKTEEDARWMKKRITEFLDKLGLELSQEKTAITHIKRGYDFLGFNIRRYDTRTLIRPSKTAIKRFRRAFKARLEIVIQKYGYQPYMIQSLNSFIQGWGQYYKWVSSKKVFKDLDHYIWHTAYRKALRLEGRRATKRGTYLKRFLPRQLSTWPPDRKYKGRQFGIWKEYRKRAILLRSLQQISIEYVPFFKGLNPYLPGNVEILKKKTRYIPRSESSIPEIPEVSGVYGAGWRATRNRILKRDGHCCTVCGTRKNLSVHHIDLRAGTPGAEEDSNLITLCLKCHGRAS